MIFDYNKLLESAGGDSELVNELISIFKDDYLKQLANIKSAIEVSNPQLLHETAHKLKGSLSNMGAYLALDQVVVLETMGINEDMLKAPTAYDKLVKCLDEVILAIASIEKAPTA